MIDNSKNTEVTYDPIYYRVMESNMISALEDGSSLLPSIDIPWMVTEYLKSDHIARAERGHPHWICKFGAVAIRDILQFKDYPKSEKDKYYYGMRLRWMAMMLIYLSYSYDIPSSKLIEIITFTDFMKQYPTRHEESFEHAGADMYKIYIDGKVNK